MVPGVLLAQAVEQRAGYGGGMARHLVWCLLTAATGVKEERDVVG